MVEIGFRVCAGSTIPAEARLEFAEMAEEMGYESYWSPHLVSRDFHAFDCLDILSAVAARTKRIKLGTLVLQVPLYHPLDLARRLVTLDHFSNGRFILGIGLGIPMEYERLGVDYASRGRRADESLEIMRRLWTEEEVTYEGEFYRVRGVIQNPHPVQKPHPRIMVGGYRHRASHRGKPGTAGMQVSFSSPMLRRGARWDGWFSGARPAEMLAEEMRLIRQAGEEIGRPIIDEEYDLTLISDGAININNDPDQARREAQEYFNTRVARGFQQADGALSFEEVQRRAPTGMGPAEGVAALVNRWLSVKGAVPALKRIVIGFGSVNPVEQLRRFHEEVRPLLQVGGG